MDVVIGLDAGTTSTKAVAATSDGQVVDTASAASAPATRDGPRAEVDPAGVLAAAHTALARAAAESRAAGHTVVGIGLGCALHALVPMTAAGRATGPLVPWHDLRAAPQARALHRAGVAADVHDRTGTPVHPLSPLVKLIWWREHDPGRVVGTAVWGGMKDLLLADLTGVLASELSSASGTGLWDARAGTWDAPALELAGIAAEQLAPVRSTTDVVGRLLPEVADRLAMSPVPVVAGAGDGPLANLGTGAVAPAMAAASLGTSGALRVVTGPPGDADRLDPRLFRYALTADLWAVGGATSAAGAVLDWARAALGGTDRPPSVVDLLAEAEQVPPWAPGVLALPQFGGERSPWWDPDLRGAVLGLDHTHRRGHLVRALVEGACLQLGLVREALTDAVPRVDGLSSPAPTTVHATGGTLRSPVWRAALAAALDRPTLVVSDPAVDPATDPRVRSGSAGGTRSAGGTGSATGTGLGAALLAHHALGSGSDLSVPAPGLSATQRIEVTAADLDQARRRRIALTRTVPALAALSADLTPAPGGPDAAS